MHGKMTAELMKRITHVEKHVCVCLEKWHLQKVSFFTRRLKISIILWLYFYVFIYSLIYTKHFFFLIFTNIFFCVFMALKLSINLLAFLFICLPRRIWYGVIKERSYEKWRTHQNTTNVKCCSLFTHLVLGNPNNFVFCNFWKLPVMSRWWMRFCFFNIDFHILNFSYSYKFYMKYIG